MTKILNIKPGSIIDEEVNDMAGSYLIFNRLDGTYSHCTGFDIHGEEIGPVHLSAVTPLVHVKTNPDGTKVYKILDEKAVDKFKKIASDTKVIGEKK